MTRALNSNKQTIATGTERLKKEHHGTCHIFFLLLFLIFLKKHKHHKNEGPVDAQLLYHALEKQHRWIAHADDVLFLSIDVDLCHRLQFSCILIMKSVLRKLHVESKFIGIMLYSIACCELTKLLKPHRV